MELGETLGIKTEYARLKVLEYAEEASWILVLQETSSDEESLDDPFWYGAFQIPFTGEEGEEGSAEAGAADDLSLVHEDSEEDGDFNEICVYTEEGDWMNFSISIGMEPRFFRDNAREVIEIISSYGLGVEVDDEEDPGDWRFDINYRVYLCGFNYEVFHFIVDNLLSCAEELMDFQERRNQPSRC